MHYKSSFDAFILSCNAPDNASYDLINTYNHR